MFYLLTFFYSDIFFQQIDEIVDNGLSRTKFAETFRMSTYLAAWAILPDTYAKRVDDDQEPMVRVSII